MISCYLALGSNLRSPERQLRQAIRRLYHLPASNIQKISSIYLSAPLGFGVQPRYCNLVLAINTRLSPIKLLDYCQQIEKKHQRIRKKKWASRTLDIDILLYGQKQISSPRLILPHPEMTHRDFVMIPFLEIAPHFNHDHQCDLPATQKFILKVKNKVPSYND